MKRIIGLTALTAISMSTFAEEEKSISADLEFGFISTSGNTDSNSLLGKLGIKQNLTKWRNQFLIEGLYKNDESTDDDTGDTERETTAQKYFISAQSDLKLDDKHKGFFVYGSYEDDRFSGYEYQASIAIGFSDRLFETPNSHLNYSVGPGVAFTKTEDSIDDNGVFIESEEEENFVIRLSADYLYQISPNAKFTQTFSTDYSPNSDDNTKTKAESAVTANLNSSLALKASFAITNNSVVLDGIEKTDSQTAVTLVYNF